MAPAAAWLAASAVSSLVGAGVSAYGMIQQGRATKAQAEFDAKVQENNAISAGYAAAEAARDAEAEAQALEGERRRVLAQGNVAGAVSGISLTGSFSDTQLDTSMQIEKDIALSRYRGRVTSYNIRNQGGQMITQAGMTRAAGRWASRSANLQAAGTILSAAGNTAGNVAMFKRS